MRSSLFYTPRRGLSRQSLTYAARAGSRPPAPSPLRGPRCTPGAVLYTLYGQNELYEDLTGVPGSMSDRKQIRTEYKGSTLKAGDLIFSTISGIATLVTSDHEGYLFTQNYVRMEPLNTPIDKKFMAYLINENSKIKRQFKQNLQGSQVVRYSLSLLKEIQLPKLPSIEIQRIMGDIYFKQLRLRALKQRVADNTYRKAINMLQGVN